MTAWLISYKAGDKLMVK